MEKIIGLIDAPFTLFQNMTDEEVAMKAEFEAINFFESCNIF